MFKAGDAVKTCKGDKIGGKFMGTVVGMGKGRTLPNGARVATVRVKKDRSNIVVSCLSKNLSYVQDEC